MAAIFRSAPRLQPAVEPNVVPFIDILLVLLIIFMITAPLATTDLRLDLPRPGPSPAAAIAPTIVEIHAAPGGYRLSLAGEEVSPEGLPQRALAHILARDPTLTASDAYADARVFVRADLDVAYQSVISVLERLQQEGFAKVAILAQDADAA